MLRCKSRDFPIVLLIFNGTALRVETLFEAANALLSLWPDEDGEDYVVAVKDCLDAMTGLIPASEARRSFLRAADEAGIRAIALATDGGLRDPRSQENAA